MANKFYDYINMNRLINEFSDYESPIFDVFLDRIKRHGIAFCYKNSILSDDCVYIVTFLVTQNFSCLYYVGKWVDCTFSINIAELYEFKCSVSACCMQGGKVDDLKINSLRKYIEKHLPEKPIEVEKSSLRIIHGLFEFTNIIPKCYKFNSDFTAELEKIEKAEKAEQAELAEKAKQAELAEKAKQNQNFERVDIIDRSELKEYKKKEKKSKKEKTVNDIVLQS